MGLRNPVALAGVVGVGIPVLAAGVVAALTIDPGGNGLDPHVHASTPAAQAGPTAPPTPPVPPAPGAPPATKHPDEPQPGRFEPATLSFVSATEGWVLGKLSLCTATPCLALRHTTDGGRSWQQAPLPAPLRDARDGTLAFADARNGFIWARGTLFTTHDGGTTWHPVDFGGDTATGQWTLTVTKDDAYLTAAHPDGTATLFISPVDSDSWTETTDIPAGYRDPGDVIASADFLGNRGWLVATGRFTTGARLLNGTWTPWQLPCGGNGPADWHAFSEKRVVVLCGRYGVAGNDLPTTRLLTSLDGGATFTETGTLQEGLSERAMLVTADPTHLVAILEDRVFTSADGGQSWTLSYQPDRVGEPGGGQFVSDTTGFILMTRTGPRMDTSVLLVTHDAGTTWSPVDVGS